MRIAVLSRNFSAAGGGAERYAVALVEALAARHEIHVFAQRVAHDWPGVRYHTVSSPGARPRWINQLWFATVTWWATRRGFDVVHSHENTWHGNVQTVHVLPVRHNLLDGQAGWRRALRWLKIAASPRLMTYLWLENRRFSPRPGRRIVVTSQTVLPVMARSYPGTAASLALVSPGISLPAQLPTATRRAAARALLGLPAAGVLLLLVANDYRKKGLKTLLQALPALPADTLLAIAGSDSQRPQFESQARVAGVAGRVFFLGSLSDMQPAYEAADCLVHPTLEDTFAMVVLEAMGHALPVVVSGPAYCGIASSLSDGVNAVIVDRPDDAQALVQALAPLIETPALRLRLGTAAATFASQHQWSDVARAQEAIYVAAAASGGRR